MRLSAALMLLACLLASLLWSSPAYGHAALVMAEPAHGSTLQTAPATLTLRFNEPVSPLVIKLLTPDGRTELLEEARQQDNTLVVSLPGLTSRGTYVLSWRVVSADGHPVGGSLLFSLGTATESVASATVTNEASINQARNLALWTARVLTYVGLFMGVGAAAFSAFFVSSAPASHKEKAKPSGAGWLWLGTVATLVSILLFGLDALDAPFSAWQQSAIWQVAWASTVGLAVGLTGCALAFAWLSGRVQKPARMRSCAAAALCMLGLALASSGHASLATPQWLARPALWLHGVAIALWIGNLLPLHQTLGERFKNSRFQALQDFSRVIPWVLTGLFVSGLVLAWLQLGRLAALWSTDYGLVLLTKLGLVLLLVGLGALNRYRWTQATLCQDLLARRRLRQVIRAEVLIVLLILGVAGLWRFTPPPRNLPSAAPAESAVERFTVHLHGSGAMVQLAFKPSATGSGLSLDLQLRDTEGRPLAAQAVELEFSSAANDIEAIAFPAIQVSPGRWQVDAFSLPGLADWQVQARVLVSDFDRLVLHADFSFPSTMELP